MTATSSQLHEALRACAAGIYPTQAGIELLISHDTWLHRSDFTTQFVHAGTSITDSLTTTAQIDWPAAITALDAGTLPCSGGEQRMLRLASSLAGGTPVSLRDTLTGIDNRNTQLVITAILHASGQPPLPRIP
jgi:hypothetical protein